MKKIAKTTKFIKNTRYREIDLNYKITNSYYTATTDNQQTLKTKPKITIIFFILWKKKIKL